jgi:hypothetical protein
MGQSYTATISERLETFGGISREAMSAWEAPEEETMQILMEHLLDNICEVFAGTCLKPDTADVLWNVVNVFHNKARKLENDLDANVMRRRDLTERQDGSEVASHELEEAHAAGLSLQRRLAATEALRDFGAEVFAQRTGDVRLPRSGSKAGGKALTAAVIDSRDFANARNVEKTQRLIPEGRKIIVAGGKCDDVGRVYAVLDKTLQKLQGRREKMVLLHGGAKGAELIAAAWAQSRGVPQIVFKPDWKRHDKAAPFKRNDAMLATAPAGLVMINKEGGIHEQLLRGAKKMGIAVKEL